MTTITKDQTTTSKTLFSITDSICEGCGKPFTPTSGQQRRCKSKCSRDATRITGAQTFVGVDGEGVTHEDGTHSYVLLSCGDKSFHKSGKELSFLEILDFLWSVYDARASYVGFFLTYDFTMWVKSLPEGRAWALLTDAGAAKRKRRVNPTPFPVQYKQWEFDILPPMRRFKFRPIGAKDWFTICDAGSFFQCSFLSAIDPMQWVEHPLCTPEEWETILEGKQKRSTAGFDPAMIKYNVTENIVMARLMGALDAGFMKTGVKLSKTQWIGSGQAAQAWLDTIGCITSERVQEIVPADVLRMARDSYYGGWFDIFCVGHIPGVTYEYDINSAYPYAISNLPCLEHGQWRRGYDADVALVYADVCSDHPVMPHRTPNGSIARVRKTRGYYWQHELRAAEKIPGTIVTRYEGWEYVKECDCRPFARVEEVYAERLAVGKNTIHGKANKLLLNSMYGKFAQSAGTPKYSNPIYASYITSICRTMIIDAIATHPRGYDDLVMVATDGVYFRSKHPSLNVSKTELGAWDEGEKINLTCFMPGVYWDDATRDNLKSVKSRGVSAKALAREIEKIDAQFRFADLSSGIYPEANVRIDFSVISARQALARHKWEDCGRTISIDAPCRCGHAPGTCPETFKKLSSNPRAKLSRVVWSGDVWRGVPYGDCLESLPYSKDIGMDSKIYTVDGDVISGIAEALK